MERILVVCAESEWIFTQQEQAHNGKQTYLESKSGLMFWFCKTGAWMVGECKNMKLELGRICSGTYGCEFPYLASSWLELIGRHWVESSIRVVLIAEEKVARPNSVTDLIPSVNSKGPKVYPSSKEVQNTNAGRPVQKRKPTSDPRVVTETYWVKPKFAHII